MERKQYFDVFNWRRKWKGKLVGLQCFIFSPAHQNATPQFKEKTQEKMGTKRSGLKKTKITVCCHFCFYHMFLLSIIFVFCLFLLLFICLPFLFHPFFPLLFWIFVCVYIYIYIYIFFFTRFSFLICFVLLFFIF